MTWKGWEDFVPAQPDVFKVKRSKYGAVKTTVDGITFDSKREADRYVELRMMEKAGLIAGLKLQQRFELCAPKTNLRGDVSDPSWMMTVGHYVADFCYDELTPEATCFVIEDVKGVRTALYQWKKRHMHAQYGIEIREI